MEIKVLGCHGGETPKHRTSSFVLDGKVAIDAGAICGGLTLKEQKALRAVMVSHAHMDHVRDLASLADNRCQMGGTPLVVAGTPWTLRALQKHFFNNILWPDFSKIPLSDGGGMTLEWLPMKPEKVYDIGGFRASAVLVTHTIECAAFVAERDGTAIAYSGDTGPTDRFWEVLAGVPTLKALLMEVSFPDDKLWLANASGHHTPETLNREMEKLNPQHDPRELPVLLYHIKPHFQREVERQLAKIKKRSFEVLSIGDEWIV